MRSHPSWQTNAQIYNIVWSLYLTKQDGKFHFLHSILSKCFVFKVFQCIFEIIWKIRLCWFQDCWVWECPLIEKDGRGTNSAEQGHPLAVELSLSVLEPRLLCTVYSSWDEKPAHPPENVMCGWGIILGKMLTWTKLCLQLQVNGLPLTSAVAHPSVTVWSFQSPIFNNLWHHHLTGEKASQDLCTWCMEEALVVWASGIRVTAWVIAGKTSSAGLGFCTWSLELDCAYNSH